MPTKDPVQPTGASAPKEKRKAGAQKGNQHAVKLKDPELRQQAYDHLCDWIAHGKSYKSYVFYFDGGAITGEGIDEMSRRDPDEFDPHKKEIAHALGYRHWEKIVEDTADGNNPYGNTATLQMVMRNKFGWDKRDGTGQSEIDRERFKFLGDWMDKAFAKAKENEKSKKPQEG